MQYGQGKLALRKFSPAIYGLVLICFFLPLVVVSCEDMQVATFTGMQLVTGKTIQQSDMFGRKHVEKVPSEPLAVCVLITAIMGLIFSFLKNRTAFISTAIVGITGFILLLFLKANIDGDILKEGKGLLRTQYSVVFWLALFLFAAGYNFFLLFGAAPWLKKSLSIKNNTLHTFIAPSVAQRMREAAIFVKHAGAPRNISKSCLYY